MGQIKLNIVEIQSVIVEIQSFTVESLLRYKCSQFLCNSRTELMQFASIPFAFQRSKLISFTDRAHNVHSVSFQQSKCPVCKGYKVI